jgi:hypothetical protein
MEHVQILTSADSIGEPEPFWLEFERTRSADELGCESNIRRYGSLCTCGAHRPSQFRA